MTETTSKARTGSGAPKGGWRVLLVLSLALNLAVIGVVGGALLRGEKGLRPPPRFDVAAGPYGAALSPEDRRAIAMRLRQSEAGRAMSPRARRAAMAELVGALRADPFDVQRVADILADQRRRSQDLVLELEAAILDRVATMTPDERAAFADRLEAAASRRGRPGGPDGG